MSESRSRAKENWKKAHRRHREKSEHADAESGKVRKKRRESKGDYDDIRRKKSVLPPEFDPETRLKNRTWEEPPMITSEQAAFLNKALIVGLFVIGSLLGTLFISKLLEMVRCKAKQQPDKIKTEIQMDSDSELIQLLIPPETTVFPTTTVAEVATMGTFPTRFCPDDMAYSIILKVREMNGKPVDVTSHGDKTSELALLRAERLALKMSFIVSLFEVAVKEVKYEDFQVIPSENAWQVTLDVYMDMRESAPQLMWLGIPVDNHYNKIRPRYMKYHEFLLNRLEIESEVVDFKMCWTPFHENLVEYHKAKYIYPKSPADIHPSWQVTSETHLSPMDIEPY